MAARDNASFIATFDAIVDVLPTRRLYTWLNDDVSEAQTFTYSEMRHQATAVCCMLRVRWQVGVGERAMLVYPPGLDFLVAFFACQYASVIAVPYYPPQISATLAPSASALRLLVDGLEKMRRVVKNCEPVLFLSNKAYLRAKLASGLVYRAAGCAWPESWEWHATDGLARLSKAEEQWLSEWLPRRLSPVAPSETSSDEIAFLQYTSGSTGQPKGVSVGAANLLANIKAMKGASPRSARGCVGDAIALVSWLPQFHDMGLVGACLAPAILGWRADLMAPASFLRRPATWLEAILRAKLRLAGHGASHRKL